MKRRFQSFDNLFKVSGGAGDEYFWEAVQIPFGSVFEKSFCRCFSACTRIADYQTDIPFFDEIIGRSKNYR